MSHTRALDHLETSFSTGVDIDEIAKQMSSERHYFGWSFLSGVHGEKVERAFHLFASEIENQIIRIKGKDWYYSGSRTMNIKQTAPDFTLNDGNGNDWTLSSHKGKPVVLLFYPGDNTPVCTAQLCSVRDHWSEYQATGAEVVGISMDSAESHKNFAEKKKLPLTLLSDDKGEVTKLYDVKSWLPGRSARAVVVIDGNGKIAYRKVEAVSLFKPKDDDILEAIRKAQNN